MDAIWTYFQLHACNLVGISVSHFLPIPFALLASRMIMMLNLTSRNSNMLKSNIFLIFIFF